MKCNASLVAVMLSASWASGLAENVATAVNIISGITADEEYCLSAQGGDTIESVRVRGGRAQVRSRSEFISLRLHEHRTCGRWQALQLGRGGSPGLSFDRVLVCGFLRRFHFAFEVH